MGLINETDGFKYFDEVKDLPDKWQQWVVDNDLYIGLRVGQKDHLDRVTLSVITGFELNIDHDSIRIELTHYENPTDRCNPGYFFTHEFERGKIQGVR